MSRVRAPTAMRRPISRVRSVTETSMMFMIPMPPTSRLTEATLMSSMVMVFAISTRVAAISSTVRTVKSSSSGPVVRWRWRSRRVISTAVGSTSSALAGRDRDLVQVGDAEQLLLQGRVGRDDDVVLVLAELALALGGQHADDAEGQVPDADDLADGIRSGNRIFATRRPEQAPPCPRAGRRGR